MNVNLSCSVLVHVEMDVSTFDFLFRFFVDSMDRHETEPGGFMFNNQKLLLAGSAALPFTLDQLRQAIRVLQNCYPGADGAAPATALKEELQHAFNSAKDAQSLVNSSLVLMEFGALQEA